MAVPSAVFLLGKQGYPERRDIGMFSFAGILECFSFQEYPCVFLAGISGCSPLQGYRGVLLCSGMKIQISPLKLHTHSCLMHRYYITCLLQNSFAGTASPNTGHCPCPGPVGSLVWFGRCPSLSLEPGSAQNPRSVQGGAATSPRAVARQVVKYKSFP